jgi:hypothetical protein
MNQTLVKAANKLDELGLFHKADTIDKIVKKASLEKVSQYVGVIGYVLKQERCMQNCIRRKRTEKKGSMQEIVLDCLKEYQDGQDYHNTEWTEKYATLLKNYPNNLQKVSKLFIEELYKINNIDTHLENLRIANSIIEKSGLDNSEISNLIEDVQTLQDITHESL